MSSDEKELLIAIMVDDQNVSLDFHENRIGVDYKKLVQFIEKKYEALNPKIVLKKLYTAVNSKLTKAKQRFFYKIKSEKIGFIVETRTIKTIILPDGSKKRKADVDTLLDMQM
ncbi:MAG TPA: NYN domain-containing protein [Candidatus Pacebacteria bacterium]|nr:NYN domain-containing protein [Candidatus Paceibacterota bacterium]